MTRLQYRKQHHPCSKRNRKKLSQEGKLSERVMTAIMPEEKKEVDRITLTSLTISKYFPKSFTSKKIEETIIKLSEQWQRKRQREMER